MLTAVSALTVLASARLTLMALRPPRARNAVNERELIWIAIIFAAIGFSIKLLVVVPYTLGLLNAQVVPGALLSLDLLAPVSIYLMMRYSILAKSAWLPAAIGLTAIEVAIGVLLFNKSEVIITIIMFVMGYLSQGITLLRGAVSSATILVVFGLAVPVTDYGRTEAPRLYGELGGTLSQRLQLLQSYYSAAPELVIEEKVQGTYARLSYLHAAAFAMNLYDSGQPGHTLQNAWALAVPRVIWPEKPNITEIGQDFNELAIGSRTSASAPGLFADAYWDYGWWGVPLLFLPMGALFALMSRYAIWVQRTGRWMLFPVVLMMMRMGFRVDGFYITDILGPIFLLIAYHIILSFADKLMRNALQFGSRPHD